MASNSKEYELAIKIAGKVEKSLLSSLNMTKDELDSVTKQANKTSQGIRSGFSDGFKDINKNFSGLEKVAKTVFKTITAVATAAAIAVGSIAVASASAGIDFESAFAGVKKTTEATAEEYEELRQGILEMTHELPASAVAIAEVAESAGQLGIAKENLLAFTRVMIDLGESTNLTANDAATNLAKFANITSMDPELYSNLGSSIVALGNNFATTEADIVAMSMRLAGAGSQIGLSQADIVGLSTALSSVGIEAEMGGSAFSKVMVNMQVATKTGLSQVQDLEAATGMTRRELELMSSNSSTAFKELADSLSMTADEVNNIIDAGNSLESFSNIAGMTAEEFKQAFETDAVGAIGAFVQGLGSAEEKGTSAIELLDEMGISEVRLRDALLRAGNASELFGSAVELSNTAWSENVALTDEAAQRYETTESKIAILKNTVTELGIKAFDSLKEPIRAAIDFLGEFIATISTKIDNGAVENVIDSFKKNLPTAMRHVKNFTTAFLDFISPVLSFGNWCLKNPKVITGVLVGIGSAIITYKLAEGIMSVADGFTGLAKVLTNPFALTILAVSAALGIAGGLAAAIKQAETEAKNQNLKAHFGDIQLSLEDLEEAAKHIVQSQSLEKVNEALSALEKAKGLQNSVVQSIEELNTMNWKVALGIELSESDKEDYIANINSFVSDTQELLTQQQYALAITVDLLSGEGEQSDWINEKFSTFFSNSQQELATLGVELQGVVNAAFEDGLLTIDEIKVITELQNQMATITEKLAMSEFDAKMEVFEMQLGGKVTAESFMNLQAQVDEEVQAVKDSINESLIMDITGAKVLLDEGEIDVTEYQSMVDTFKSEALEQIGEVELKATKFLTDTIMNQYQETFDTLSPQITESANQALESAIEGIELTGNAVLNWDPNIIKEQLNLNGLNESTQAALGDLFKGMEPRLEGLEELKQKCLERGEEIPQCVVEGISDVAVIGALAGDENAMWTLLANQAVESEEYTAALKTMQEAGTYVPESIVKGIEESEQSLANAAKNMTDDLKTNVQNYLANGVSATMPVNVTAQYSVTTRSGLGNIAGNIPGFATGGIITKPTLATFAEEGPEAAIPLDGSQNAIDLWQMAGRILGVFGGYTGEEPSPFDIRNFDEPSNFEGLLYDMETGSTTNTSIEHNTSEPNINYSPTLNFYGGTPTQEDIVSAGRTSQEEFEAMMHQWIKDNGRVSFG